eukprot:1247354-Prymnesium_polylepis.1
MFPRSRPPLAPPREQTFATTIIALGTYGVAQSTTGIKAITFDCSTCQPISTGRAAGGSLWVQYKGTQNYDSGYDRTATKYQDKVYVHLLRKTSNPAYGQGTELWASVGQGENYADSYSGKTVYVCAINSPTSTFTGSARVAIGTSLSDAQNRCGPVPSSPPPAPPASPPPPCVPCTFTLSTVSYGSEISWDVDGTITSTGSYSSNQDYTQTECLTAGAHVLNMKD